MAESSKITQREREIGDRLRAFRDSKLISRTAFAVSVGIGYQRLESYEAGRVPLPYGVFKSINERHLVTARWLVTGQSPVTWGEPLDETVLARKPHPREVLSAVYDDVLRGEYERRDGVATKVIFGPGGLMESLEKLLAVLDDPAESAKISPAMSEQLLRNFGKAMLVLGDKLHEENLVKGALRRKRKKP